MYSVHYPSFLHLADTHAFAARLLLCRGRVEEARDALRVVAAYSPAFFAGFDY